MLGTWVLRVCSQRHQMPRFPSTHLLSQLPGGGQYQGLGGFQVQLNLLQDGDGKGGGLPSARLGLGDNIVT